MIDTKLQAEVPSVAANSGPAASSQQRLTYGLLGILGVALGLRLWGINFGLPYDFTPDEVHEIVRALKLGAGEYSWSPGKGGLYLLLFVEYGLLYVFWWLTGTVDNPTDFAFQYLQDPTAFYLAGRVTVAIMGAATCYVLYLVGKRIKDVRLGIVTAVFGATAYYHAMWSHYINVDIGMVLAVWMSILAYMEFERRKTIRWLILAGVSCGVAFAFKFTGAVALIPVAVAVATPLSKWKSPWQPIKEGLIVLLAMAVTTSAVAPENILGIGQVAGDFTALVENDEQGPALSEEQEAGMEFDSTVRQVTVLKGPDYLSILLRPHNLLFSLLALVGAAIAVRKRYRWDLVLSTLVLVFLAVMTLADRPGEERYLLPIVPALWLLSARAITELFADRQRLLIGACALVVAVSLFPLVRQNVTWTLPDTRVLAKDWIEANVAPDSKILMDGMRYRFIQSPPLLPNETAVSRRVGGAASEERLSRGVSDRTLELYATAMAQVEGPKYDLYSTVWGLGVEPLSYYPDHCFDYVVISSDNSRRFSSPGQTAEYPMSAAFYSNISTHQQYELVRSFHPAPWEIQGPAIDIYAVESTQSACY